MELMAMKQKQREQRKRYARNTLKFFWSKKEGNAKNTLRSYVSKTGDTGKRIGRNWPRLNGKSIARHTLKESASIKKQQFDVLKKKRPLKESTSSKGQWQVNAQCYNNIKREQEAQSSCWMNTFYFDCQTRPVSQEEMTIFLWMNFCENLI